ncbi:hypothetical protein GF339_16750 [candidate division KSB3 bacterium]|uniref:Zinc-ribbon domain-containing protein n=1 Tax=candidate division KSB3 bacterium TaxID=2044937 RepID=A0A9D5JY01_9BACT|nr:hypothetical protein [candidate division KSB3 bacterium]
METYLIIAGILCVIIVISSKLFSRHETPEKSSCPACGKRYGGNPRNCPHCGEKLRW